MPSENSDLLSTSSQNEAVDEAILLRSAKVLHRAQEVFGDQDAASSWFKREVRSLGGVTPLSLIHTDRGFELVMHTLARIEYGIPA